MIRYAFNRYTYSKHNDIDDILKNKDLARVVGHVANPFGNWKEFHEQASNRSRLTFVKTHDLPEDDSKAIYIVRDGRAAIASYHHYLKNYARGHVPSLAEIIVGAVSFGSWSSHIEAWHPQNRPNTLMLRYEDLCIQPEREIQKISEFIGLPADDGRPLDFRTLSNRFPKFFRQGNNQRNIDEYTADEAALFALCHAEWMEKLGYNLAPPFTRELAKLGVAARSLQRDLAAKVNWDAHERSRLRAEREVQRFKSQSAEEEYARARAEIAAHNEILSSANTTLTQKVSELEAKLNKTTSGILALQKIISDKNVEIEELISPSGDRATRARATGLWRFSSLQFRRINSRLSMLRESRKGFESVVPPQWKILPPQPDFDPVERRKFGIAVFSYNRPALLENTLTSLGQQQVLNRTHVFIDGDQGNPRRRIEIDGVTKVAEKFPVQEIRRYRGNYGFRRIMLNAMQTMSDQYDQILFLEDDCFPTKDCISTMWSELDEIADDPKVFSIYGHHFKMPLEKKAVEAGKPFGRFQGWGWATTSEKLRPILAELKYWYDREEEEFLRFTHQSLTPEILKFIDVTPGRQPSLTLRKFFAWDETLCLLTALKGMGHRPTSKRVIYNCGASADASHFHDVEHYRAPPFNLVSPHEVWELF